MFSESMQPARPSRRRQVEHAARVSREAVAHAIERSIEALSSHQSAEGFWCGELTADTTLESDYILLQLWLHQPSGAEWNPPGRERIDKAARSILERQLPDGGFNIYQGGPSD